MKTTTKSCLCGNYNAIRGMDYHIFVYFDGPILRKVELVNPSTENIHQDVVDWQEYHDGRDWVLEGKCLTTLQRGPAMVVFDALCHRIKEQEEYDEQEEYERQEEYEQIVNA